MQTNPHENNTQLNVIKERTLNHSVIAVKITVQTIDADKKALRQHGKLSNLFSPL